MLIVDAQVHIWGANTPERPWPARLEAHRDVPIGKDELLREMNAAGVDRVIIVPPSWEGDRNDLALAAAQAHPDRIAERHPGLKLVMDHLALTRLTKDEEAFRDIEKLLALAKRPNVAVKATALPCYTNDTYPYRRLHPYLRRVYDAFGPTRVFWGTDLSRLPCTYRQGVTMFTEEIPWMTAEDKAWIMGRGVCEWVGWKAHDPLPI